MEEKFKVIFQVTVSQIPKAIELLKNKTNVEFNSTSIHTDQILKDTFKQSHKIGWNNCDAVVTNNPNNIHLQELRERGVKIRIITNE